LTLDDVQQNVVLSLSQCLTESSIGTILLELKVVSDPQIKTFPEFS